MPATDPTQSCWWHVDTTISPDRSLASASSKVDASPSNRAPPITARRCPPVYSSHGIGAPEVRTTFGAMPGTTSPAGRTASRTGSAAVIRSNARWFAPARSASCVSNGSATCAPPIDVLVEVQVPVALPLRDRVVELLPLPVLELQIRLLQGAHHLIRQRVYLERPDRLEQRPRQDLHLALLQLVA